MNRAVESLLDFDLGVSKVMFARRRLDLVGHAGEADGVVVGDSPLVLGAEDRRQVQCRIRPSPCSNRVGWQLAKTLAVSGDELLVEVSGRSLAVMDAVADQLSHQAVLEGSVDAFASSSGLGTIGEDQVDLESLHCDLEGCWRYLAALDGSKVICRDELAAAGRDSRPAAGRA